jgi:hypothetical protein
MKPMRKHATIAIEGGTVRIARWMRELHGASQRSANIFRERAQSANPRAATERALNRTRLLVQIVIGASAAIGACLAQNERVNFSVAACVVPLAVNSNGMATILSAVPPSANCTLMEVAVKSWSAVAVPASVVTETAIVPVLRPVRAAAMLSAGTVGNRGRHLIESSDKAVA